MEVEHIANNYKQTFESHGWKKKNNIDTLIAAFYERT